MSKPKRPEKQEARRPTEGGVSAFLRNYAGREPARFHMPGHKGRGHSLRCGPAWDITEIPGADNLLAPTGILARAQEEAAAFFGASATLFLPGGSSQGMLAAILSLPRDATVYCSRDCHGSLISALALSGHAARFLPPCYEEDGRPAPPSPEHIAAVLGKEGQGRAQARPRALVITRPDYYGRCADIEAIAAFCREENVILVVDEAHGAHFSLTPLLPSSAISYGDLVFASAHKTLDAPNPAAYLHLGGGPLASEKSALERAARMVGSTSPSYPLLAALDDAWRNRQEAWEEHMAWLENWRKSLPALWQAALLRGQTGEGVSAADPTRLCFDLGECGDGYALDAYLRSRGVFLEMADHRRVVAITSPLDQEEWYERLAEGLLCYAAETTERAAVSKSLPPLAPPPPPEQVCSIREAALAPAEAPGEEEALSDRLVGRICARSAGAYPPGAAILCPGERIDRETLAYMRALQDRGASLFGLPILCVRE